MRGGEGSKLYEWKLANGGALKCVVKRLPIGGECLLHALARCMQHNRCLGPFAAGYNNALQTTSSREMDSGVQIGRVNSTWVGFSTSLSFSSEKIFKNWGSLTLDQHSTTLWHNVSKFAPRSWIIPAEAINISIVRLNDSTVHFTPSNLDLVSIHTPS